MDLKELTEYIEQGRELEFILEKREYFLGPDYSGGYYIYDEQMGKNVAEGRMEFILDFPFADGFTLRNNTEKFCFKYIL